MTAALQPVLPETLPEARASTVPSRLKLCFTLDDNRTRMAVPIQEPPWRAIRAFQNAASQAVVHLHNVSGGILSGDSLDLSIAAGAGARVQVTSVGSTRIYRQRPGAPAARLLTSIAIDDGAVLEYLPDSVIPFSNSRFHQSTHVALGANAGFIGWELIAAGRIASGEEFTFDSFQSEFEIRSPNRPIALERYSLAPAVRDPRSAARWGRFRYTATFYVCHTGVTQKQWLELESQLNDLAFTLSSSAARWGVSALAAAGLAIRGMALEAHHINAGLHTFWAIAKQQLWGERAIPPRKIN